MLCLLFHYLNKKNRELLENSAIIFLQFCDICYIFCKGLHDAMQLKKLKE